MIIEKLWLEYFKKCKIRIADYETLKYTSNLKDAYYNAIGDFYLKLFELRQNGNQDNFNKFMDEIINELIVYHILKGSGNKKRNKL